MEQKSDNFSGKINFAEFFINFFERVRNVVDFTITATTASRPVKFNCNSELLIAIPYIATFVRCTHNERVETFGFIEGDRIEDSWKLRVEG